MVRQTLGADAHPDDLGRGCGHLVRGEIQVGRKRQTRGDFKGITIGTYLRSCAMASSSCANSLVVEGMSRDIVAVRAVGHETSTSPAQGECSGL